MSTQFLVAIAWPTQQWLVFDRSTALREFSTHEEACRFRDKREAEFTESLLRKGGAHGG